MIYVQPKADSYKMGEDGFIESRALTEKVFQGERISSDDAIELYRWPLEELGVLANARRDFAKANSYGGRGREIVTYIVDRNINYTNVCNVYCNSARFTGPRRIKITTCFPSNNLMKNSTNFPRPAVFKY